MKKTLLLLISKETNNIDQDALSYLKSYTWPGNIRELENFIKRIVTLYPNESISLELIKEELLGLNSNRLSDESTMRSLSDYVDKYLSQFTIDELINDELGLYQSVLVEFERPILNYVMKRTNNNQIKASQILGLNRNTLRKKLRSLKMDVSKL